MAAPCPTCGSRPPDGARFCSACGAPQTADVDVLDRKPVAVLFCDLVGSTELGERLDSELLRVVMGRYFAAMREAVERHGGIVEKFIGDAVVAVFGIPATREDDVVRAARAALDMAAARKALDAELFTRHAVRVRARTGIEAGEAVIGDRSPGHALATGGVMNTAARLEQAAGAEETFVGPRAAELLRDVAELERVGDITLKGKRTPLTVHRLLRLREESLTRSTPLVGRRRELGLLKQAADLAVAEGGCLLAWVTGEPGAGKSRLVEELVRAAAAERTLGVRFAPYGETTWSPLASGIRRYLALQRDAPAQAVRAAVTRTLPRGEAELGDRVAALLDASPVAYELAELAQAAERWIFAQARDGLLVVVLDDLQWAPAAFLEFVGRLAARPAGGTPVLAVAISRPELVQPIAGTRLEISLGPLGAEDADALLHHAAPGLPRDQRARAVDRARGNPLFLRELGRMVAERQGDAEMPATLAAVLGARLDRLASEERAALQAAAVAGEELEPDDLRALLADWAPDRLQERLDGLSRADLLLAYEGRLRFRHLLVRDAAYARLPHRDRAELHERLGAHLARRAGDNIAPVGDVVGHHLEQAFLSLRTIGTTRDDLRDRAADALRAAAYRALERGDALSARPLLERAARLYPDPSPRRSDLLTDVAQVVLKMGLMLEARDLADEAARGASAAGARSCELRALLTSKLAAMFMLDADDLPTLCDAVEQELSLPGDARTVRLAFRARAVRHRARSQYLESDRATRAALACEHGVPGWERGEDLVELAGAMVLGPTPTSRAIAELERMREENPEQAHLGYWISIGLALMHAQRGHERLARQLLEGTRDVLARYGLAHEAAGARAAEAVAAELRGDLVGAAELHAQASAEEEAVGDLSGASTDAALAAARLAELGANAGAQHWLARARELTAAGDVATEAYAGCAELRIRAGDDPARDEALAERLRGLAASTDDLVLRGDVLLWVAGWSGRNADARAALAAYSAKEHLVGVARATALLQAATPASPD